MKIAYLDTISGIAGDMTLAAFVSAGVSLDELTAELHKLPVGGFELIGRHVTRNGIVAVQIDISVSDESHRHRNLKDIVTIIDGSSLSPATKTRAKFMFQILAEAEAKIHNTLPEKVHFHEVGAIDAIVDIVGTAICLERMGIDRVFTSAVKVGNGGLVQSEHGSLPIPSPATLEILKGYPVVFTSLPYELTTPTGAAIVKGLSSGVMADDSITPLAIGYGAGTKDFSEIPNLLRVVIGEQASPLEHDEVHLIETNIDDMMPQVYPSIIEKLLASGANDAYLTPVIMKKGRPGMLLSVMTTPEKLNPIIDLIYANTSTIGLRIQKVSRRKLPRREVMVETSFGRVRAKSVLRNGKESIAAEFEECKRISEERGLPLLEVLRTLERELSNR